MKTPAILNSLCLLLVLFTLNACKSVKPLNQTSTVYPEEKLGWKFGSQAYTFRKFNFFEAIDKIDSCGLRYVEAYRNQPLGGGLEGVMDYKMSTEKQQQILKKLKEKGVTIYAFGVVKGLTDDEWRQLFIFCKAMGIQTITAEPLEKSLPLLSQLCDQYKINLAIHNHPKPSYYWDVDVVLKAIKGHSKRIGACADVGHWIRSGQDPIANLKKLEGRVLHLHMKDLNELNQRKAHDVRWGNGVSNIKGIADELKRQKFKGMLSVEYEYNWDHSAPDVAASVKYFRSIL
jgi:sugar phosphate isomerase/epimerase